MKLRKVLCMTALAAAVAFTGVPVSGAAGIVHAEEIQTANLDEILRQMYALYSAGDYASMSVLDVSPATEAYVDVILNSGSDRYILDLDGNTKAMLYVAPEGDWWWWYFGQMENNLRQGTGTTISIGSSSIETFTGSYIADFPSGAGKESVVFDSGAVFDISGSFQGEYLNGTYQVNSNWTSDDGTPHSSSLPITYANNHLQAVGGWELEIDRSADMFIDEYVFWNNNDIAFVDIEKEYELFAIGFDDDYYYYWAKAPESLASGLTIFKGNAAASALTSSATPAPETTVPVPTEPAAPAPEEVIVPETPVVPQTTVTPGTYTVERGDNLSKIAQKVYGDQNLWKKIYEANKDVIKSDYIIWANQVLIIPAL